MSQRVKTSFSGSSKNATRTTTASTSAAPFRGHSACFPLKGRRRRTSRSSKWATLCTAVSKTAGEECRRSWRACQRRGLRTASDSSTGGCFQSARLTCPKVCSTRTTSSSTRSGEWFRTRLQRDTTADSGSTRAPQSKSSWSLRQYWCQKDSTMTKSRHSLKTSPRRLSPFSSLIVLFPPSWSALLSFSCPD